MKAKSRKSKRDPKNIIPAWEGWSDYFSSAEGRDNICTMLNRCVGHSLRYSSRKGEIPDYDGDIEPSELAIELVSIDPELKELIPADVLNQIGDVSAAIDLAAFADDPHLVKDARQSVRTSIVLMSHGVSRVEIAYTGGSDQCDPNGVAVIHHPIGGEKETLYSDGEELSSFMSAWGIDIDCFWMFCDDSGAGDGSGWWTAQVVAELMPEFSGYTTEPEYQEYECDNCGEVQSLCTCSQCDSCGDMFSPEEVPAGEVKSTVCEWCRDKAKDGESAVRG